MGVFNKNIQLVFLLMFSCANQIFAYDIAGVEIPFENDNESKVYQRLLGKYPIQEWRSRPECFSRTESEIKKVNHALCHLRAAIQQSGQDPNVANIIIEIAEHYQLFLMLDQSKTRQSMRMQFDRRTYENYVEYASNELESIWTLEQVNVVKEVLSNLPKQLTTFEYMKNIYLLPDHYFLMRDRSIPRQRPNIVAITGNPTFYNGQLKNEGIMVLFPFPFYRFGNNLDSKKTLVHELAHAWDHATEHRKGHMISSEEEWWSLSWKKNNGDFSPLPRSYFVSDYAMTSPVEDFAESVATFFYNPEFLKKNCPKKWLFIKNLLSFNKYSSPFPVALF